MTAPRQVGPGPSQVGPSTTPDTYTYIAGRVGCRWLVKVGSSRDPARRSRSIGEDRTAAPVAAHGRPVRMLAAWLGPPTEADLLDQYAEHRWRTPTGRATEYVLIEPPVRDLLDERCPDWHDLLACDTASLRPIHARDGPR